VVLGPGPAALDVVVVATPLKGINPADCRPAPGHLYNMHTAIDVDLPERLDARDIDDVGAGRRRRTGRQTSPLGPSLDCDGGPLWAVRASPPYFGRISRCLPANLRLSTAISPGSPQRHARG